MSIERFAGVVSWCLQQGVGEVTLLGGEPSLHPLFVDMISLAVRQQLKVRVVTNGARQFRRLLADTTIGKHNLTRVAVSLDTLDPTVQDEFRGRGAWQDAMDTIGLLRRHEVPFDINLTAMRPVLSGVDELIGFAERQGCRRVNIHWPSNMGIGSGLSEDQIPSRGEWEDLVRRIESRIEQRRGFFVEIERGFLAEGEPLSGCALADFTNLEIMPDGRAYRCGLLVDQPAMASLTMVVDELRLARPDRGEELLLSTMPDSCDGCPVKQVDGRRACILDKVSSLSLG